MFSRTPQYITHQLLHFFKCRAVNVLLVVLATLLGMAAPLANAAQTTVYGPKTASISPKKGNSTDVFSNVDTYSPGRNVEGPFTLIVENQSPDMNPGDKHARKSLKVEIWHNSKRIATDSDFFNSDGKATKGFQKAIDIRSFSNLVVVKVIGKIPVRFTYKVVAGKADASPAQVTGLGPNPLGLTNGTSGVLNATLKPAPVAAGSLALSSSNPAAATVPETVPFTAGQVSVAIPVQSTGTGQSSITAKLNGSSASANVNVAPAPAKVVSLLPTQSTLQQGAPGQLQVSIAPSQLENTVVTLASSDPAKVSVPATVVVPAGQTSVGFTAQGVAVGNAQVTASFNNMAGLSSAAAQVQVVPVPPTVVSILPATNVLQKGSTAQLVVKLSASQSTDTIVALQARTSGVVELPSSVVVQAGASQVGFAVNAIEVGNTLVAATLNGSTVESAVQVTPVPAAVAALAPATSNVVVGGTSQLTLKLNNAQSTVTTVALAADPSGIVQVPGTVQVPVGQTEVVFAATALAVGQADVVATLNGSTQRATVVVSPVPAAIAEISPNPFGLQEGASGNLTIRLNNAQSAPVTVMLAVANLGLLRVPESVVIPAGQISQTVSVQALQAGSTQLVGTLNGANQSVVVNITVPPPQIATLEPASQDLPKGKLGKLVIQLDRSPLAPVLVSIANSNSAVLGLPAQVTIPAGQMSVEIPMTALSLGQTTVSATLNGSSKSVQVTVVEPEIVGIVITPDAVTVTPGQSTQVQATGTYSDGSTKNITTGQGTVWSTASETIATVTPEGRVTGVAEGQTVLSARRAVQPTYGNPTPSEIVAQAAVTVGSPAPLAISAPKTELLVGETVVLSITAPYAAGATAYTVNLASSGTAALQHPATVSINPGLVSVNVNVTATTAGTVQLTASAAQFASGQISFTVSNPVSSNVAVTGLSPTSGAVGSIVTIDGSGFTTPANTNTVAFAGNAPAVVQSGSATQLVVRVPDSAQTGSITVSNTNGSAQSDTFTVLREQDFSFQVSPSSVNIIQGSSASVVLNLASVGTNNFEGLAKLTATGLPQGVTATFDPPSLSAFQTGKLTLQAESSAALASATVTVRAEATLNGLPWVRQSNVAVSVVSKTGVTGVKGRFITPEGNGIAGVIVRQDTTTNQVLTDAAGNFTITGLASGVTTLRFDATPANPLYPIWPMNVSLDAGELRTYEDWIINPPPTDEKFVAISNAAQEQRISDERFPGFEVVLPAGATITGWDGVRKTRIAVEKVLPNELPVTPPPIAIKEAYQLYFGTPMGGIPSEPIPVSIPNSQGHEPGDQVDIWWFDGSPMGGTGEWKVAGQGTVSADGRTVQSNPGVGIPRFCGVCGLVCIPPPPPPPPCSGPSCGCGEGMCCSGGSGGGGGGDGGPTGGNPILLSTGDVQHELEGLSCGMEKGFRPSWSYNAVDAFNNNGGTTTSFGMGWTFSYDMVFLPNNGLVKQLVMPGRQIIRFVASQENPEVYRSEGDSRMVGFEARAVGTKSAGFGSSSIWEITSSGGQIWRFEPFTDISRLVGVPAYLVEMRDRSGNKVNIERNTKGHITRVRDNADRGFTLSYGTNGFASQMQDHTGRVQSFDYDSDDRIARTTDPAGRVHEYGYVDLPLYNNAADKNPQATACFNDTILARPRVNLGGREYPLSKGLASQLYPDSDQPTVNIFNTDKVVAQTTSKGESWKFEYKRTGACVVKVADEASKTWAYTCRAGQPLSARQCAGGACTEPMEGLCPDVDSEEARSQGWRFYGGNNQRTSVTKPDGSRYTQWFDGRGNLIKYQNELGQITEMAFDAQQRKVAETDALGRTKRYAYNASGKRVGEQLPLGRGSSWSYNAANQRLSESARWLNVPSTDAQGNPLSYTPLTTSYAYDSQGNLISTRDPLGHVSRSVYDSQGRLIESIAAARQSASSIPMLRDGAQASVPPSARRTTFEYNAAGDLIAMTNALGNRSQNVTDELGRVTEQTDPLLYSSLQQYNKMDQPTVSINALGQQSRMEYDGAGRVTAVFNAAGVAVERYEYDNQGRKIRTIDASGAATLFEYDAMNRISAVTDRKGQRSATSYTSTGQVASVTTPERTVTYTYDAAGRVAEISDATTSVRYRYDEAGRTIQVDTTTAAGTHRLAYEYDSLDRTTQRTLSGTGIATPEVTTYQWDHAGRLTEQRTVIGPAGAQTEHRTSYQFDPATRLQSRSSQVTGSGPAEPAISQHYFYDEVDRLTRIEYLQNAGAANEQLLERIDYSYDAKGQRTAKTTLNNHGTGISDTPMQATYDAANRMQSITLRPSSDAGTHKTYNLSYDANGNLIEKVNAADSGERTVYTWDAADKLIALSKTENGQTTTASFQYDLFGRRVSSSVQEGSNPAQTVQYLYEGQQALGEIRSQRLSHRLITGLSLDETIARIAIAGTGAADLQASRQLLTDALNSVIAQANAQGTGIANSYSYSPYGETSIVGPDSTNNTGQYTSRENDAQGATGLYFYRARYYDPILKRFISEDPIGLAGGVNVFAYVDGNPISFNDPTGNVAAAAPLIIEVCIAAGAKAAAATTAIVAGVVVIYKAVTCDDCPPEEKCDPPEGTTCLDYHNTGTPHSVSDIDGIRLEPQTPHVHTWQMNKGPNGCIWNKKKSWKSTFNFSPLGVLPCATYPSWVNQRGK